MDPKKDIWQQFRDQEDAWDESPPTSAWDKLNARLDAAPPAHPGRPWKPFALPGLGILLVLLMGFGLVRTGLESPPPRVMASTVVENVIPKPPEREVPPVSEQVVSEEMVDVDPPDLTDSISDVFVENFEDITYQDYEPVPAQKQRGYEQNYVALDSLFPIGNTAPYAYDNSDLEVGQMVVTNGYGNVLDTVRSLEQYRGGVDAGDYNFADNQYLQLNMRRNEISYSPRGRQEDAVVLDHFNWLLGSWKREGPSGATFEQWRQLDRFNIEGRGYFTVNGDTMVAEKMRIEQRGENVYYIVALDTHMRPIKFRLRSSSPGELIFENKRNPFPKEIIVRQADDNNFSTTFNGGKRGPRKKEEEVRKMKRANSNFGQ